MAILSSNQDEFDMSEDGIRDAAKFIKDYMVYAIDFRNSCSLPPVKFHVSIGVSSTQRNMPKAQYAAQLARELKNNPLKVNSYLGIEYNAHFDFKSRKYIWQRKEIYITPAEELMLYKTLIDGKKAVGAAKVMLYRLRKKFGKEFPGKDIG
jgi:primosomal protein N'